MLAPGASIHGSLAAAQVVDARDKHGHDDGGAYLLSMIFFRFCNPPV